jgi:hypothetical protein
MPLLLHLRLLLPEQASQMLPVQSICFGWWHTLHEVTLASMQDIPFPLALLVCSTGPAAGVLVLFAPRLLRLQLLLFSDGQPCSASSASARSLLQQLICTDAFIALPEQGT